MYDSTPDSVARRTGARECPSALARCAACGTPVRGVTTARPGEHRFVDCGHSANVLRVFQAANAFDASDIAADHSDDPDSVVSVR